MHGEDASFNEQHKTLGAELQSIESGLSLDESQFTELETQISQLQVELQSTRDRIAKTIEKKNSLIDSINSIYLQAQKIRSRLSLLNHQAPIFEKSKALADTILQQVEKKRTELKALLSTLLHPTEHSTIPPGPTDKASTFHAVDVVMVGLAPILGDLANTPLPEKYN